ncbi:hypothetical protein [Paenibacillus flagellatus]|uniref:hypothetical protein n=1 Tax=Paenibacillus flagellatus TaxID=2211139 RepID=UPI0011B693DB|nr:hypothetical protein [Paenibacillus flagellatus]
MFTTENNTMIAETTRVFKHYPQYLALVRNSCQQHYILFIRCAKTDKFRFRSAKTYAQVDKTKSDRAETMSGGVEEGEPDKIFKCARIDFWSPK